MRYQIAQKVHASTDPHDTEPLTGSALTDAIWGVLGADFQLLTADFNVIIPDIIAGYLGDLDWL